MKTYIILTLDEVEIHVTSVEFFAALNTRDEGGKSLFYWYDDGEYSSVEHRYIRGDNNYLFPKSSKRFSDSYGIHHSDIENQRGKDKRRTGSGFFTVPMETVYDGKTVEREIKDERSEHDIYTNAERSELLKHFRIVLGELRALDREIIIILYGLEGQAPKSKTACAATLRKNWRTIDRAEERALVKLRDLLADFADYT